MGEGLRSFSDLGIKPLTKMATDKMLNNKHSDFECMLLRDETGSICHYETG